MKNRNCIIVTLGHNSSALFFDGEKAYGYEQERLDKVKASSVFPIDAIERVVSEHDLTGATMFISHWYDRFNLSEVNDKKHLDMEYVNRLVEKYGMTLMALSEDFTHHDAHAYSSLAFLLDNFRQKHLEMLEGKRIHFIVADGFGNKQEVLSVYSCEIGNVLNSLCPILTLEHRAYGYMSSLGLMYQYATSFCGMKENQDEYKFLGYESHIKEVLSQRSIMKLEDISDWCANKLLRSMFVEPKPYQVSMDYINLDDLRLTKEEWNDTFIKVLDVTELKMETAFAKRVIIGNFIQNVLEIVMSEVINKFKIDNVCLSGGLFYNVKLNNHILKEVTGIVSVIPLAGDQGAGIGFYQRYMGRFRFGDMCYGKRDNLDPGLLVPDGDYSPYLNNIYVTNDLGLTVNVLTHLIEKDRIVNFVEGNMEFGPRALCHTSTLALPSSANVDTINKMNKRNTVMPMAPVMLESELDFFFNRGLFDRVVGSDRYMIVTYDYKQTVDLETYRGVMHKYPLSNIFSGRPQVVSADDDKVVKLVLQNLKDSKCLINTSYNVHGNPILFDYKSILDDFKFQCDIADEEDLNRPYLVLYV